MNLVDGIYICNWCGLASKVDDYISWINSGVLSNDCDDDYENIPGYEELYDEDGEYVYCPYCYKHLTPLKLHEGKVVCPRCKSILSLEEFGKLI